MMEGLQHADCHDLPSINPLTHPLTHSFIHSLTHPLTHSFIHSLTHSPTHSSTHSPTHSSTHSPIRSLTHLFKLSCAFIKRKLYLFNSLVFLLKHFKLFLSKRISIVHSTHSEGIWSSEHSLHATLFILKRFDLVGKDKMSG